jgi:hypothetical protein
MDDGFIAGPTATMSKEDPPDSTENTEPTRFDPRTYAGPVMPEIETIRKR